MSEVSTFFRHCPSCGRRFEIRLVNKKLVDNRTTTQDIKGAMVAPGGIGAMGGMGGGYGMGNYVYVEEDVPLTIDVEEFQYTYKCKHCSHVWTELHNEESRG